MKIKKDIQIGVTNLDDEDQFERDYESPPKAYLNFNP